VVRTHTQGSEDYGSDLELFNTVIRFLKSYVQLVAEIYCVIAAFRFGYVAG